MRSTTRARGAATGAAVLAVLMTAVGCGGESAPVTAAPAGDASEVASDAATDAASGDAAAASVSDEGPCARLLKEEVSDVMKVDIDQTRLAPLLSDDACLYVVAGSDAREPASVYVQVSQTTEDTYDLSRRVSPGAEDVDGLRGKAFLARGTHGEPKVESYVDGTHRRIWILEGSTKPFPPDVAERAVKLMTVLLAR